MAKIVPKKPKKKGAKITTSTKAMVGVKAAAEKPARAAVLKKRGSKTNTGDLVRARKKVQGTHGMAGQLKKSRPGLAKKKK